MESARPGDRAGAGRRFISMVSVPFLMFSIVQDGGLSLPVHKFPPLYTARKAHKLLIWGSSVS